MAVTYRDTIFELYTIGAVDPNSQHIWGFQSAAQRETFLSKHLSKTITDCIYWKVGDKIKINATGSSGYSFENSYYYDYVRITNRPGTAKEFKWYCFITGRKYLNLNCTELELEPDWVQTFYFNSNSTPFWGVQGYGVATTDLSILPPRGIGSEYPALSRVNLWQADDIIYDPTNYAIVIYSTIDIRSNYSNNGNTLTFINDPETSPYPVSGLFGGVYLGAYPYLLYNSDLLTKMNIAFAFNTKMNESGQLGSITGMYMCPKEIIPNLPDESQNQAIVVLDSTYNVVVDVPLPNTLQNAPSVVNPVLLGYDYTYISITNMQGEEQIYHYEDFNGQPEFVQYITFASGYPCLILAPGDNYKYGDEDQRELFAMKQTNAIQCSLSSDNYAIWQAQNRNSIQASIDSGKLTVANAKEAQSKTGGIASMLDNLFTKAGNSLQSMLPNLGLSEEMQNAITTGGYQGLNSLLSYGMLGSFGLEASYVYNQQVKVAQQAMKSIEAQFADKKYLPTTLAGSNAYGDLARLKQYGFRITIVGLSSKEYTDLDRINESSGHICKGLVACRKSRQKFDYWRMLEAKITNAPYNRPQFVNAMMTKLFSDGLYLWWVQSNGDIDTANFAHPYALTNTPLGGD